jgi:hypothetical protein
MEEFGCCYCGKSFQLSEIVVSSGDNKLFCAPKKAPLEPGSCALKYIETHPEEFGKSYYFIKLESKER